MENKKIIMEDKKDKAFHALLDVLLALGLLLVLALVIVPFFTLDVKASQADEYDMQTTEPTIEPISDIGCSCACPNYTTMLEALELELQVLNNKEFPNFEMIDYTDKLDKLDNSVKGLQKEIDETNLILSQKAETIDYNDKLDKLDSSVKVLQKQIDETNETLSNIADKVKEEPEPAPDYTEQIYHMRDTIDNMYELQKSVSENDLTVSENSIDLGIMEKPLEDYTVSESLLVMIFGFMVVNAILTNFMIKGR